MIESLSKNQKDIQLKIEDILLSDQNKVLHLYGEVGSGKTYLIKQSINSIKKYEDWTVYYIEGKSELTDSFSTISFAKEVTAPMLENTGISFNISGIIPKIISAGLSSTFKIRQEFDPKINFFVNKLKKLTTSNIVIVADNFHYWDSASQGFLMSLRNSFAKLARNKNLKIILITDTNKENYTSKISYSDLLKLNLKLPNTDDIPEILNLMGYKDINFELDELSHIMSATGGNMHFLKFLIEGYYLSKPTDFATDTTMFDMTKLLELRLEAFGEKQKEFSKVLQTLSILSEDFESKEIKYLCSEIADIDEFLELSCERFFLQKSNEFSFSNELMKKLFYQQLEDKKLTLHSKYAEYLQKNRPDKYLNRAFHLSLADTKKQKANEIIGLLTLAYFRNLERSNNTADCEYIFSKLKEIVDKDSKYETQKQFKNFLNLKLAYELYIKEEYKKSHDILNTILNGSILFNSEVLRIRLLVSLMLNMDTKNVENSVKEISFSLEYLKNNEKEQWSQCAFVLFSTYSNKLSDYDNSEKIARELRQFVNENSEIELYNYMNQIINRKSFIFETILLSKTHVEDSVEYFQRIEDYTQYYFSLCNYSGILLILGEYDQSISHLQACLNLIKTYDYLTFPAHQKIYNNLFLAEFLMTFRGSKFLDSEKLDITIKKFKNEISDIPSEKDAIMYINLINLYIIKKEYSTCHNLLYVLKKNILLDNQDSFYDYYINNIYVALNIVQENWSEAELYIEKLITVFPEFHKKNAKKIWHRNDVLKQLVKQRICLEPVQLDEWCLNNSEKEDIGSQFYSRLFLFSDLQFSSL